ncbi:unnamed protein product [Bursaphelenchus okinawaensis]|uniref:Uncharacterized protein n=1 Tax=Bursaphelenchus okinawaensis TaxID=465554 RepID=A0A811K1K2_9BILA|nr:unnamed protein product [Bursaphelenchus okinawaensis]CAG9090029.1 unnamed protein product [Bursaphelenchus okinawaensis]
MKADESLRQKLLQAELLPAKDGYDICARIYRFVHQNDRLVQSSTNICPRAEPLNDEDIKITLAPQDSEVRRVVLNLTTPENMFVLFVVDANNYIMKYDSSTKSFRPFISERKYLGLHITDKYVITQKCDGDEVEYRSYDGQLYPKTKDSSVSYCGQYGHGRDLGEEGIVP